MRLQPLESVQLIIGAGGDMLLFTDSWSDKYSKRRESVESVLCVPGAVFSRCSHLNQAICTVG